MTTFNLPIFPLSIFLLPQGITRLRIFEARYLKMVSLAMKNNGFVILPNASASTSELKTIGSWVEIIDFDQSENGLLLIDVRCKCLVDVSALQQDENQLHHAQVNRRAHWSETRVNETNDKIASSLKQVFSHNTELDNLYVDKNFQLANWVVARWLELLPVKLDEKNAFIEQDSFHHAMQFVEAIILAEESNN